MEEMKIMIERFDRIEQLVKNNYANLKEDIIELKKVMDEYKAFQLEDHDKLIELKSMYKTQERELGKFEKKEENYGKRTNDQLEIIKKDVDSYKLSFWKIFGIAIGVGAVVGILAAAGNCATNIYKTTKSINKIIK